MGDESRGREGVGVGFGVGNVDATTNETSATVVFLLPLTTNLLRVGCRRIE